MKKADNIALLGLAALVILSTRKRAKEGRQRPIFSGLTAAFAGRGALLPANLADIEITSESIE